MRVIYWVIARGNNGISNFSVTGEGSIEEECKKDAEEKAKVLTRFANTFELQKVATL